MAGEKQFVLLEREKHEPAREYAKRCLEYNIINFNLEPGVMVSEKILSDKLGVSMTPVREAIFSLAQIGIIEVYPQRGSAVALIDTNLVEESRFMRWAVEREVVAEVCKAYSEEKVEILRLRMNISMQKKAMKNCDAIKMLELDNEFHKIIYYAADKKMVYEYLCRFRIHFDRVRMLDIMSSNTVRNLDEHELIANAIEKGDVISAQKLIDTHLSHVTYDMADLKNKYPKWFK